MKKYGLIVVGGGFSGVMTAVAAARDGMEVLLVEKSGALGGAPCLNYVLPFMDYEVKIDGKRKLLNRGLFEEFLGRMDKYAGIYGDSVIKENRRCYNEEFLKVVLDDMTAEYGVDVLFHTTLVAAKTDGERVESITVLNVEGQSELYADYFADSTGDAMLSVLSGCSCHVGRAADSKCQPMTLCFRMGNVDVDAFYKNDHKNINALWKEKLAAGELLNPRENVLTFRHSTDSVLHLNSTRVLYSPVNALERSKAESIARKQMLELYAFLKENAPSCKRATLLSSAPEIGVRESRMIDGLYTMTQDDIVECRKFPDAIAAGNYDIDIHSPDGSGTSHYFLPEGEFYTVPYRSLIPQGKTNLIVAGRCISSTHEAQASYRIIPIVACIGEGAGIVVAIAAKHGLPLYDVDIAELRGQIDERDLVEGYAK